MIFTINDRAVDTDVFEVRHAGAQIPVEPQVFDLLVLLLKNRDRLVTKDEIIDQVWQGRIVSDATVSSRIKAARLAIGDNGNEQHCIRTVRRRGFRVVADVSSSSSSDGALHAPCANGSGSTIQLTDKPSIAVLRFTNIGQDPGCDSFADGIAEDIITALSRMPWFCVIARSSSFTFNATTVDVKQVSVELGVRYILNGSVRKAGCRLRVGAQLIDAATGSHVWADRYDRDVVDIFDVQDEVTQAIVAAVVPQFLSMEARRAKRKDPAELNAWECVMRGRAHLWKLGRADAAITRGLFERAIALSPCGELGISDLAVAHFLEAHYGWTNTPLASQKLMLDTARRAVAIDETDPLALTILGWANLVAHNWDEALPPVDRALQFSPGFAPAIGIRGTILALLGESVEAIESLNRAVRLSPFDSFMPFWLMGLVWANQSLGRYDEAVDGAQRAIRLVPDNPTFRRQLASSYARLGCLNEARRALKDYLRLEPGHTIADASKVSTMIPQHREHFLDALRTAGLPG